MAEVIGQDGLNLLAGIYAADAPALLHLDSGYITAPILVSRKPQYGIEVIGPGHFDVKWQANTDRGIDWDQQQATCPQGHTNISWTPVIDNRKNEVIKIRFSRHRLSALSLCGFLYPFRLSCTTALVDRASTSPTSSIAGRPSPATDTSVC